ncbi:nucleotide modification associated domain-containing protein [Dolosigranulum pigrum]|uniref:nucleotide modification associated domain-containing protein n=1 Tax=Dolosigranulum pigrum TaxID=29394 RepID=UPI001AD879D6|nr:nucleotide modification associated domain-containing protein [Dolosigranulum pigrum]QTJ54258.1 DUF1599 domain-containing protein [Dolosigranulum pigrum]
MTFKDLLDELLETYEKKNSDYGDSFKQTHLQFGEIAGLVRISDKVNRLVSLSKKTPDNQNYESKRDTYMDLANYCLMQVLVMEETESTELTGQDWFKKVQDDLRKHIGVLGGDALEITDKSMTEEFNTDDYIQHKGPWGSKDMLLSNKSIDNTPKDSAQAYSQWGKKMTEYLSRRFGN